MRAGAFPPLERPDHFPKPIPESRSSRNGGSAATPGFSHALSDTGCRRNRFRLSARASNFTMRCHPDSFPASSMNPGCNAPYPTRRATSIWRHENASPHRRFHKISRKMRLIKFFPEKIAFFLVSTTKNRVFPDFSSNGGRRQTCRFDLSRRSDVVP